MKTEATETGVVGAVVYVRVSTTGQAESDTDDGYSLGVQKRVAKVRAHELGASFTETFVEPGHTATTMRRPQLQAALERAKQPDIRWFVVHKVNRFARNTLDGLAIVRELEAHGVELVSVSESWDSTPGGHFIKNMYFNLAEMYSRELSEEVTTKMAEKARRGGTPGHCPLGYINVRQEIDGVPNVARVEIDPGRAEHVRWAFKAFASGEYTLNSLRRELEERGLTARKTRRYPERPVSRSALHKMLRNPYYVGIVTWGGQTYPGNHEPLIDHYTFDKVQAVLEGNNTGGDKSWRYKQYLKGTLRCGMCHELLSFTHGRGKGGEYEYLFCRGRQRKNGCTQRYIPVHLAEEAVARHYRHVQAEVTRRMPEIERAFEELLEQHESRSAQEAKRQRARIQRLERRQDKLIELTYDDALPVEKARSELKSLTGEIDMARARLESTQVEIGDLRTRFGQLCQLMKTIEKTYSAASDENRRALNRFWFEWVAITENEIVDHELTDLPEFILDHVNTATNSSGKWQHRHNAGAFGTNRLFSTASPGAGIRPLKKKEPRSDCDLGSNVDVLVGQPAFEPTTSSSRTRRATNLRHCPCW